MVRKMTGGCRRTLLKGLVGTVGATSLAGCTDVLEGGAGSEPETHYEIDVQTVSDADYSDLEFEEGEPFTLEELRQEQDHGQIQYTINEYEDDEKTGEIDPDLITNIEVELEKYDDTLTLEDLEQLENTYADDQLLQLGYQELLDGENHIEITATLENDETLEAETSIHKTDPKKEHQEKREEYINEISETGRTNWKNWVDTNIDDMKVEKNPDPDSPHSERHYIQRQLATIANEWVGEITSHPTRPSRHAEDLGITLEYAFQEHLDTQLQAGQISNNHLEGGTHHTVIARNTETENIWHVDTGGGHTTEPENFSGDGGRYRTSLDWGHHHTEDRGMAEVLATAFTRVEWATSEFGERLSHTDEALEHIVTLKRENGDYNTIQEQTRNAALLAHKYPNQQFQIDKNGETNLVIAAQ